MKLDEAEKILNKNGYVLQETRRLGKQDKIAKYEAMKKELIEKLDGDCPSQESLTKLGYEMIGDPHDGDFYYAAAKPDAKRNTIFDQVYDGSVLIDVSDYDLIYYKKPYIWFKYLEKVAANKYLD